MVISIVGGNQYSGSSGVGGNQYSGSSGVGGNQYSGNSSIGGNQYNINVNQFIALLTSYGFYPCINKQTRVSKASATIIDHIWVNDVDMVSKSGILLLDVSDHFSSFICYEGIIERNKD